MKRIFQHFLGGVLLCAAAVVVPAIGSADTGSTLHAGDKLTISVLNHPELLSTPIVDASGNVSVPIVGTVSAQNLTTPQLARRIEHALQRYVREPAVDVQLLLQGNSLAVVGPVSATLLYTPGETLLNALAQVEAGQNVGSIGGPTASPSSSSPTIDLRTLRESGVDLRSVVIDRDGNALPAANVEQLIAQGEPGPALAPGDTIVLRERPIAIPITGEVLHPVTAHLYPDEPLGDALRQAGGVIDTTSTVKFLLVRDGRERTVLSSSPVFLAPPQVGDSIVIPHALRVGVVGGVTHPGPVVLQGDGTLLSAIYYAGGPVLDGDLAHIAVVHDGQKAQYNLARLKNGVPVDNPQLADGDTVFVPTAVHVNYSTVFQGIIAATYLQKIKLF